MSIFDKMFGHEEKKPEQQQPPQGQWQQPPPPPPAGYAQQAGQPAGPAPLNDEQAIARYKYMLKTAPPETIEQAHQEAFAQLTPQQRQQVLQQLNAAVPASERPAPSIVDDPQAMARMATRAEVRQPGTLERVLGGGATAGAAGGSGLGMGSVIGGSLLTSLAGGFIGSAIADHFFNNTSAGRGFFGGGGGFGGGYGGGFGGPGVVNETTNIYEGGRDSGQNYSSANDDPGDDATDNSGNTSNDDAGDDATDDGGSYNDDSGSDDSGSDDSGSDDSGSYDDGSGSDDSGSDYN